MLFMAGGESNRNFAHHKYSIASPLRRLHFRSLLFCTDTNDQGAPDPEFCKFLESACPTGLS
jgi:hypothetical protein